MMRILIRFIAWLQTSFFLRFFGVRPERRNAFLESRFFNAQASQEHVTWFHASSLGELEMLRPLIDDFYARGVKIGVSCFSDSALRSLKTLAPIAVYADLSPREDEWKRLFERFKVNKLILAKYDVWPGLMNAATLAKVPVIVINAQMRRSLSRMMKLFVVLGVKFPRLFLFPNDIISEGELQKNITGDKKLFLSVDPRWERVARRLKHAKSSSAVVQWSERMVHLPHPIGVLGSIWVDDLNVILPALKKTKDSIVLVPHDLSEANLSRIENLIEDADLNHRALLVNEMGILVELYRLADWAFVGGGFGKGIHSVLEPSLYGIPVACGPARFSEFSETRELSEMELLTRCETTESFARWLSEKQKSGMPKNCLESKHKQYRALLEECIRIQ